MGAEKSIIGAIGCYEPGEANMAEIIFMIHGMFCGGWVWDNYRDYFENKGYRCRAVDLRFHDRSLQSPPHPRLAATGVLDYAADLAKEIHRLDSPPILMGHSLGALLAQILAAHGLGHALVLLTPAPPYGIFALRPSVIRTFSSHLIRWGLWKKPIHLSFAAAAYAVLNRLPRSERHRVYGRLGYESGRAAAQIGFWFLDPRHTTRVDETRIKCPVLVLAGGRDKITPASVARRVAAKYKTVSTYKAFDRHSHWMFGEPGWQETADFIYQWLRQVG